ncbi:50S ribosomal protein L13 [Candidatus Woesearchaeota archaeon]|nr:50S ribosomal protein L13 [Candidatus Woesearchaeota archaeon]
MIINAENLILGRIATVAAKKALLGEKVEIVNCEKAIITGSKKEIAARYKAKREMGQVYHGPYILRRPERFVKRAIRGMLPYKQEKGRKAFDNIRCHIGVPEELKEKEMETIEKANISKVPSLKYVTVGNICKLMGAK